MHGFLKIEILLLFTNSPKAKNRALGKTLPIFSFIQKLRFLHLITQPKKKCVTLLEVCRLPHLYSDLQKEERGERSCPQYVNAKN